MSLCSSKDELNRIRTIHNVCYITILITFKTLYTAILYFLFLFSHSQRLLLSKYHYFMVQCSVNIKCSVLCLHYKLAFYIIKLFVKKWFVWKYPTVRKTLKKTAAVVSILLFTAHFFVEIQGHTDRGSHLCLLPFEVCVLCNIYSIFFCGTLHWH